MFSRSLVLLVCSCAWSGCFLSHSPVDEGPTPTPGPAPLSSHANVAMADRLICAVDALGDARCAGHYTSRVGGTLLPIESPSRVIVSGVVSIATSGDHVCVVLLEGGVRCWGFNTYGQLSLPADGWSDDVVFRGEPVAVAGIDDAVAVSTGDLHSCALREGGQVLCWGAAHEAPPLAPDASPEVPRVVPGLGEVTRLESRCALERSGRVLCFGSDAYHLLGEHPESGVGVIEGLPSELLDIAVVGHSGLALDAEGTLWGWGMDLPHLAHDGPESFGSRARPLPIASLEGARRVVGGSRRGGFVCLLREDGALHCGGDNSTGQLALGYVEVGPLRYDAPPPLALASALPALRQVATDGARSCGISATDDSLLCWGDDAEGLLLGAGSTRTGDDPAFAHERARTVGVGIHFACSVDFHGQVACWGSGEGGRLGLGDARSRLTPTPVPGLDDVSALSVGALAACALRRGEVLCWGADESPVLQRASPTPTRVELPGDALSISVGAAHACALVRTSAGRRAVCWGQGSRGQLGDSTFPSSAGPRVIEVLGEPSSVIAADGATCVTRDGVVSCIGDRGRHQVGEGREAVRITPELIAERGHEHLFIALEPVEVATGGRVRLLQSGLGTTCAWLDVGSACWGPDLGPVRAYATAELLSVGRALCSASEHACVDALSDATEDALPEGELTMISSTSEVACARRADSSVVCWGRGAHGELGDGLAFALEPVEPSVFAL